MTSSRGGQGWCCAVQSDGCERVGQVLTGLPGVDSAVLFDVRLDAHGVARCGMLVIGSLSMRRVEEALAAAGLGHVALTNCLAMTASDLGRRAARLDPFILAIAAHPLRRVYPREAEAIIGELFAPHDQARHLERPSMNSATV